MSSMVALNDIASRTLAYTKKLLPWTPREGPPAHEQMLLKLMRSSALSDVDAAVKIVERGCFEGAAETSYEDLAKFYALASAYGSAYAMNCLACMSKHGIGVKQSVRCMLSHDASNVAHWCDRANFVIDCHH